jgi:hypothetical protein
MKHAWKRLIKNFTLEERRQEASIEEASSEKKVRPRTYA